MGNLAAFTGSDELRLLDTAFADFICRLAGGGSSVLWLAAACASKAAGNGSACCSLDDLSGETFLNAAEAAGWGGFRDAPGPDAEIMAEELARSGVVTTPGGFAPLVLDSCRRLYLHRYWAYEHDLGETLLRMAAAVRGDLDLKLFQEGLNRIFPASADDSSPDWQRLAAIIAATRSLAVIAGGPGTGKTTTVVKILALLLEQPGLKPLRVVLAAPTGKAAVRLVEAVANAGDALMLPETVRAAIPCQAYTLHRLLGYLPGSGHFRHNAENPLPFDLVVVDESSMVDLSLMARLAAAVRPGSRLILLGDRDQLASVEAGAVFGDICNPDQQNCFSPALHDLHGSLTGGLLDTVPVSPCHPLCDSIVTLKKSHRFSETSGIAAVSRLVNEGRGEEALDLMKSGSAPDISWRELPSAGSLGFELTGIVSAGYGPYLAATDVAECLEKFGRFRVLTPLRQGPYGVHELNVIAEHVLGVTGKRSGTAEWYRFRPVMVTRNDYQLGLANGDTGITLPDDRGDLAVWFPSTDGECRHYAPLALQSCDTLFAMTVHKAQGSEFDSLLILLPPASRDILARELLYTAITRGRKRVEIWGDEASFIAAAGRRTERSSGLRDRLWPEL